MAPSSTIYSAFPLASPFGRAIAYTALFEGTLLQTLAYGLGKDSPNVHRLRLHNPRLDVDCQKLTRCENRARLCRSMIAIIHAWLSFKAHPKQRSVKSFAQLHPTISRTPLISSCACESQLLFVPDLTAGVGCCLLFRRSKHLRLGLHSTPAHLDSITKTITAHNGSSPLSGLAWARKKIELAGGSLSDSSVWDDLGGLSHARRTSFGYGKTDQWLKCVVVAGGADCSPPLLRPLVAHQITTTYTVRCRSK